MGLQTQGKVIEDSFPVNQNSKMRIAGQLREKAGSCPDHTFLFPKSRDRLITHAQKRLLAD